MKQLTIVFFLLMIFSACKSSKQEKLISHYRKGQADFVQHKQVYDFSMDLSYLPASLLPRAQKSKEDFSEFYYFRLTVGFQKKVSISSQDKSALYYGLDTVFVAGDSDIGILPVLVEPIINGSLTNQEYLLVFERSAFGKNEELKIVFHDRLFTNTRLSFVFNRNKIAELESIIS